MNYRMGVMTDFSIGNSLLTVEKLVAGAKDLGLEKVVVADDMTISSLISLQKAMKDTKAMVGVKYRCYADPLFKQKTKENLYVTVKIFPKTERGLQSIFEILTLANTEERYYYNARGCFQDLSKLEECIVTSGDLFGISSSDQMDQIQLSESCSFYTEFVPANSPYWDRINYERLKCYSRTKGGVVSYPAFCLTNEESDSLPVLKAVCTNTKVDSPFLSRQYFKDFALKNGRDVEKDVEDLIARLSARYGEIEFKPLRDAVKAESFNAEPFYVFKKHKPCLPKMADDEFAVLLEKCKEGFKRRLTTECMGYKPDPSMLPQYKARLAYELSIIRKMGFAQYFLVVHDLVNWSKSNGVRVGCGRGSAGGSLIAYLMGITEVDPIRFHLIFERFINPSRQDLPDVDLDYQSSKRTQVIEYLKRRYGEDRVAGISNYGTLASASAFRDTGRVYGLSPLDMSATKLVPKENGISYTLSQAADAVPEVDKLKSDYPEIWKHALRFEGVMRSLGQHAAGTVVAGEPLVKRAVVERRAEGNVVNWDKRVVEDYGLIKMDILGLSTLDVLDIAQEYIQKRHNVKVDYLKIPLDDPKVLDAFSRGETTGVFQFDGSGMQTLLKRLGKNGRLTFEDISAATALFRPGPLDSGLTEQYVSIKQGMMSPHYDHPNMKEALKETFGVMVYQEQVMRVAQDLAGFSMAEADALRKAIGKKDADKMAHIKANFVAGCQKTSGLTASKAETIWDKIEKFAGYGFNKSHAVAYTILSYWTCYLKVYYPAEYFASQLSIVKDDKYPNIVKDARLCGIEVVPPDINASTSRFEITDDHTIVAPFSAVKGCSETTAKKIVALREKVGKFHNKQEVIDAAKQRGSGVNSRVVGNLDLVGAFASVEPEQPKATDECRRRDQIQLLTGLIVDSVTTSVVTKMNEAKKLEICNVYSEAIQCKNCDLANHPHPMPTIGGANCRYMVVFDCPSKAEEDAGKMFVGDSARLVRQAMKECGVSPAAGYYTSLVKAKKKDRFLSNGQINNCSKFLDREAELLGVGAIVCLGSSAVKHFIPDCKQPSAEVGNAYYNKKLNAMVIVGLNPMQIIFSPAKYEDLKKVFAKLAETLDVKH